jgi:hypothetical protein
MSARRTAGTMLIALAVLLACARTAPADTGTYKILDYDVKLVPRKDGKVEIGYYQKWLVTGGHVPWITVGTPNAGSTILRDKTGGNARTIAPANEGGWSGIRIDLDKDYKPNQTFEVRFAIIQSGILYDRTNAAVLDFIPGWYDRAATDRLKIEMTFFAGLDRVTADPKPARTNSRTMTWERANLPPGGRFHISVSFPREHFAEGALVERRRIPSPVSGPVSAPGRREKPSSGKCGAGALLILIPILFIIFAAVASKLGIGGSDGDYSDGGSVFFGGSGGSSSVSSCACVSCACACVSCACACACAGGGAAGCDRKLTHTCPLCATCSRKSECPLWAAA